MSATLTKNKQSGSTNGKPSTRMSRTEAAKRIQEILTNEPQSEAAIRRLILGENARGHGTSDVVRTALGVLEAQHEAMRMPGTSGTRLGGWVRYTTKADEAKAKDRVDEEISFPYRWDMVRVDAMFIDSDYQRPLTNFVDRITAKFNPVLFQTLAVSDRGAKSKPKRFAVIDGQTRWVAASRRNIPEVPCIVFTGLTPENEAEIFAMLQKERRGILSWHRFRADLRAKKPEALAIRKLVEGVGYTLGEEPGQLKAVAALEHTFRISPEELERTLVVLRAAWPDAVPETTHIRGLHFLYRHFPIEKKTTFRDIDDEKMVNRLRATGRDGLKSKMHSAKASALEGKGSNEYWMAHAMQSAYTRSAS